MGAGQDRACPALRPSGRGRLGGLEEQAGVLIGVWKLSLQKTPGVKKIIPNLLISHLFS